uniref:Uncharacterized protein n=1 Tax=Streptomyces phage Scarif TaxID=3158858 RepID=A0AAU7GZN2_9CAUD
MKNMAYNETPTKGTVVHKEILRDFTILFWALSKLDLEMFILHVREFEYLHAIATSSEEPPKDWYEYAERVLEMTENDDFFDFEE